MSEKRHNALGQFLHNTTVGDNSSVTVKVNPNLDYINLRGDPASKKFVSAVNKVLRHDLPLEANTFSSGMSTAFWLGPDEWLITSPAGDRPTLPTLLDDALQGMHASMNVLTGGQVAMRISGEHAAALLAKGCTLDLHPKKFMVGQCAQTGLAKASVLICKVDDAPTFDVIARRSFAEYLAIWLERAGSEFGIQFTNFQGHGK
jgi:sarcosine oxidase subunit gamma